jgi:ligand-binding sensor domain-containing protein/two-component sensor histidine kinase
MFRLVLISLMMLPFWLCGQQYKAVLVSVSEGLSQSSIYEIAQDRSGYLWLATQDGLNRYDGISFEIFRNEPFDSSSISSNYINALLSDSRGRLWVGTANHGINVLLPGERRFIRYMASDQPGSLTGNHITELYQDPLGTIWVGTGSGLFRVAESDQNGKPSLRFEKVPLLKNQNDSIPEPYVNVIKADNNRQLWVGTYNGLYKINTLSGKITTSEISVFSKHEHSLCDHIVYALAFDNQGNIWAGTRFGIDVLSPIGERIMTLQTQNGNAKNMFSDHVAALMKSSSGEMWVGYADQGVQVVKPDGRYEFIKPQTHHQFSVLDKGQVLSFREDVITKGLIWVGFHAGGLIRLVPVTKKFKTNHLADAPIKTPFVVNLHKENERSIWIGTSQGLLNYNRKSGTYRVYYPSDISKKPGMENYITGITGTGKGEILFGSGNTLYRISAETSGRKIRTIQVPNHIPNSNNYLRGFFEKEHNNLYVIQRYATYRFDKNNEEFTPMVLVKDREKLMDKTFFISSLYVDRQGNHWLGTSHGLELYELSRTHTFPDFSSPVQFRLDPRDTTSLRNNHVLCIAEDLKGRIWIGTMNGLARIEKFDGKYRFINYSTKNGLKNNVIYSILTDPKTGHLWLSTNNGLTEFDPAGFALSTYDVHDGLQSNEFNSYASSIADDGEMFFGGIDGYTSFYPWEIIRDTTVPVVHIAGVDLHNEVLNDNNPLKGESELKLKYKQNSFTIHFAGLHYADPQKNTYAYKLEGYHNDWIQAENVRSVNFTQLPPGSYTFKVKAANSDGVFNEAGAGLTIVILPPFYKTIWFYLLLALTVAGIIYGLFKYRLSMKMEQVREVEKIRKATAADFHDELGHKLTIISWFAEILKKKIGPDQADLRPHLDKIIEASGNLYHTMKDMLWAMDPEKDSVYDLYNQIREFGRELFDSTGIEFESGDISPQLKDKIISPSNKRHVLLIFKEVMHNSLKHAHGSATSLDLVANGKAVKFRFRDNGVGFMLNGNGSGRGLENVKRRARMIHAHISIHSDNGSGTVAELDVPVESLN